MKNQEPTILNQLPWAVALLAIALSGCVSSEAPALQPEIISPRPLRTGYYQECSFNRSGEEVCSGASAVYIADNLDGSYLIQKHEKGTPTPLVLNRTDEKAMVAQLTLQVPGEGKSMLKSISYGLAAAGRSTGSLVLWKPHCKSDNPVVRAWAIQTGASIKPGIYCEFGSIGKKDLVQLLVNLRADAIAKREFIDALKLYRPISEQDGLAIWEKEN